MDAQWALKGRSVDAEWTLDGRSVVAQWTLSGRSDAQVMRCPCGRSVEDNLPHVREVLQSPLRLSNAFLNKNRFSRCCPML